MCRSRGGDGDSLSRWRPHCRDICLGVGLNAILLTSDYIWYLSLSRTYVSLNNAIFQSICVIVYALSVAFLGEKATLLKNFALVLTVGGIVVVAATSGGGGRDTDSDVASTKIHSTPEGYCLVVTSVVFFSVYEVSFGERCVYLNCCKGRGWKLLE